MKLTVDTKAFEQAAKTMQTTVDQNVLTYGRDLGRAFENYASQGAPWVDRRGIARRGFNSSARISGSRVTVAMGAGAPNYKKGIHSSPDYMEYLEFAHGGRFAIVYPTVDAMQDTVKRDLGEAALTGHYHIAIRRDKLAARKRKAKWRSLMRQQHGGNAKYYTKGR
jgi:hypothetical protein